MSKFIIQIPKDGTIQIEAQGFSGPACTKEAESLENLLGTVIDREFKPEYYAPVVEQTVSQLENQRGF